MEVKVAPNEQGIQSSSITAPKSNTFTGKVGTIKDGDLIVVLRDKEQIDIRLKDVDCPELVQPFARQMKNQTSDLCFGKTVTVEATGKDRYGRTLAHIRLSDGNEVGRELVTASGSSVSRRHSSNVKRPRRSAAMRCSSAPFTSDSASPVSELLLFPGDSVGGSSPRLEGQAVDANAIAALKKLAARIERN